MVRVSSDVEPFEVVLTHLDGYARIRLRGDFDYPAMLSQGEVLQEITDLRSRVVVDLADVRFIDGSGVRFLVVLATTHEGLLRLENVPLNIRRVLDVMGLSDWFEFGATSA